LKSGRIIPILVVEAIIGRAIALSAIAGKTGIKRSEVMSDVVLTVTVFHTLAAVAIFGFMVVGVIGSVQRKRQQ
jgi:hypothetical protein